jgi:hypothetical protein
MGFISAFANFGSIGSTAKWAIKIYQEIKSKNKKLKPNKIFVQMINLRVTSLPSGSNEFGLDYDSHLLKYAEKAPGLAGLVIEILNTEAELFKNTGDYLEEMIKPLFEKLEDTDLSTQEKYGSFKKQHSEGNSTWILHILSFLDRVDR